MEIEILTTKKKLTKSIIKQLETGTTGDMQAFTGSQMTRGFYVRGLGKGFTEKVGIFEGIAGVWKSLLIYKWEADDDDNKAIYRYICTRASFGSESERDEWLELYSEATSRMLKNHVII